VKPEELALLAAIGNQVGLAVENARLYERAEQSAAAAERSRLARDLHDAVTQTLFSASLIAEVLPRLWDRSPDEGRRRLAELRQLTRGALAEMRTLLLELRPTALLDAPLGDLLRQLSEAITGRARVPVEFKLEGEPAVPPDIKVAFYRVAQESLNNVAKHAAASQAMVTLRCYPERTELRVSDDGRGFDPGTIPGDHLGVSIMRERAQAIGATLTIDSEPGEGTEIVLVWAKGPGQVVDA
jgi:signal transduction histidine kinase